MSAMVWWLTEMPCRITDDPSYDYDNYLEANTVPDVEEERREWIAKHREWYERQPSMIKELIAMGL